MRAEACTLEYVVPQHKADRVLSDEFLTDDESLRKAVRRWLHGIFEAYTEIASIAQQTPEPRQVDRRGDYEDVPDPGIHQDGNRIIHHRLVVHRKHLFAHSLRDRIQAGAASSGENYSFHRNDNLLHSFQAGLQGVKPARHFNSEDSLHLGLVKDRIMRPLHFRRIFLRRARTYVTAIAAQLTYSLGKLVLGDLPLVSVVVDSVLSLQSSIDHPDNQGCQIPIWSETTRRESFSAVSRCIVLTKFFP